jgi:hypothetical protein
MGNSLEDKLLEMGLIGDEIKFYSNVVGDMIDSEFALDILRKTSQMKNGKPMVYLGSNDDIIHALLFNSKHHILIDPKINDTLALGVLSNLYDLGARNSKYHQNDDSYTINYKIGDMDRKITLLPTEAMELNPEYIALIENGISGLMMKGWEQFNTGYGDIKEAQDHFFRKYLTDGGHLLTRHSPANWEKEIASGQMELFDYHGMDRVSEHKLYVKSS